MACRSPIAGAVFAVAIPGVLLAAGELIGVAKYGEAPEMYAFRLGFVWFGTLGFCAIGSVMNWWLFARLEAIEGPHEDVLYRRAGIDIVGKTGGPEEHAAMDLLEAKLREAEAGR